MIKINLTVTTIAMQWDDGNWSVDTYVRTNKSSEKKFIEKWMNVYSGNGIQKIKILDNNDFEYEINELYEFRQIYDSIKELYGKIDESLLDF